MIGGATFGLSAIALPADGSAARAPEPAAKANAESTTAIRVGDKGSSRAKTARDADFLGLCLLLPCHQLLAAGGGSKPRRQQGQRGRRRISATARCRRKVAIEAGLCRSGRTGGAAGAVAGRPLGRLRRGGPARGGERPGAAAPQGGGGAGPGGGGG